MSITSAKMSVVSEDLLSGEVVLIVKNVYMYTIIPELPNNIIMLLMHESKEAVWRERDDLWDGCCMILAIGMLCDESYT